MSNNSFDDLISETSSFLETKEQELLENFSPSEQSEPSTNSVTTLVNFDLIDPHEMLIIEATAEIEKYFWVNSELPSFTKFVENGISLQEIQDIINPKLAKRGLPVYSFRSIKVQSPVGTEFDPRFVLACNVMCKATGRSKGAKFKDLSTLGVNESMWNAWLSIPSYFEYAKNLMEIQFQSVTDIDAKMGIARNVANGDLQAIKYYHEFTNRYRPQDQNSINLVGLIAALMEILSRNVSNDVMDRIAGELEQTPIAELLKAS